MHTQEIEKMTNCYTIHNKTYHMIKLLGHGKSGYSYLVEDDEKNKYTLKKIHHEPCDYYTFSNKMESELNDYNTLKDLILIPKLIDYDIEQEIIIKEFIEGNLISDLVKTNIDMHIYIEDIRKTASKCMEKDINIDYYPTNFIVNDRGMYYVDYECNKYMKEWDFENWGIKYWIKN